MGRVLRGRARRAAGLGAIAGVAVIYLGVVGMIQAFVARNIVTGLLSLGETLMGVVVLVVAWHATRVRHPGPQDPEPGPAERLGLGALTGLVAGLVVGLFLLLADVFPDLGDILQNVNGRLISTMGFDFDPPISLGVHLVVGAVLGTLGAALHLLPPALRRAVVGGVAAVLLVSLMEPLLRVSLLQLGANAVADFLYQSGGLRPLAAVVVFIVVALLAFGWAARGRDVRERIGAMPTRRRRALDLVALAVLGLFLIALPQIVGTFLSEVLGTVGLYILLGLGLNIVVGYAGLLDLGYVAFFAVGAYVVAVLTSTALETGLDFWVAFPFVIIIGALTGLLIGAPVLRLRGDYLAIVTLGFGEIARILFLSDWFEPLLGGAQGILSVPAPQLLGTTFREPQTLYYLILAFCVLAAVVAWSLAHSRVGRAWNAMREDESVAEATGVNTTNYKLLAFALGAVFGCIAGALFAIKIGSVFAQSFPLLVSITALALIILGGMGNIVGVIVGALVLVGLPELLREFAEFRLLIYGAVLVAMMLLRPEGLVPSAQRARELHDDEDPQQQSREQATEPAPAPVLT
jgi:branched-chain amino acid transport system permease protein